MEADFSFEELARLEETIHSPDSDQSALLRELVVVEID